MSLIVFWAAAALIAYTYVLFPALLLLRARLFRRPYRSEEIRPSVSLIIAAHNEAANIGAKLDNVMLLDYPRDRLEVILASDGSTDATEAIVRRYADWGVRLLPLPRMGKAQALNNAVAASTGEVLVFSDANSMYAPDAIRALVRPFADPQVGGVAGNQRYLKNSARAGNVAGRGEQSYWSFDRKLKKMQSQAGNAISATGAIYAIRRSLFHGVPEGVTDDFATSTSVIAQGYRLVFAPDAVAYEPVAGASLAEFGRKVRVINRGLRGVLIRRELLNPFRYGFYALQLFSHKVMRRLVAFPLLALLLISPFVWEYGLFYQAVALGQLAFYACGLLGITFGETRLGRAKLFTLPAFFCMVNAAALVATINVLRGQQIKLWEPKHHSAASTPPSVAAPAATTKPTSERGPATSG